MYGRRRVLKGVGTALGSSLVLGGTVAGADGEEMILTFDPSDPEEVRRAALELQRIESRKRAEALLRRLSSAQMEALAETLPELYTVETETSRHSTHFEDRVARTADSDTYVITGKILNQAGGTECYHEHHVYWEYDGSSVTDVSHWEVAQAPGWVWYYRGNTTDYLDNRDDYALSKMGGLFEQCITTYGCVRSETIGSDVWVYPNGDAAGNGWD